LRQAYLQSIKRCIGEVAARAIVFSVLVPLVTLSDKQYYNPILVSSFCCPAQAWPTQNTFVTKLAPIEEFLIQGTTCAKKG
jgi:hypothetical protein